MKTTKKVLSLLVCLTLLLALSSAGVQAKEKTCDCSSIPIIFVPGFGGSALYLNYGTPEQTWFIGGMMHTDILLPALDEFVAFLADSKQQPTIRTSAQYPQFLVRLPDGAFAPATGG